MEKKTANASTSNNESALMIIPSKNENVPCDNTDENVGLENPTKVRNLKDILKFTTQMTNAPNESNSVDLTFSEDVSRRMSVVYIKIIISCIGFRFIYIKK